MQCPVPVLPLAPAAAPEPLHARLVLPPGGFVHVVVEVVAGVGGGVPPQRLVRHDPTVGPGRRVEEGGSGRWEAGRAACQDAGQSPLSCAQLHGCGGTRRGRMEEPRELPPVIWYRRWSQGLFSCLGFTRDTNTGPTHRAVSSRPLPVSTLIAPRTLESRPHVHVQIVSGTRVLP